MLLASAILSSITKFPLKILRLKKKRPFKFERKDRTKARFFNFSLGKKVLSFAGKKVDHLSVKKVGSNNLKEKGKKSGLI